MGVKELINKILINSGIKDPNAEAKRIKAEMEKEGALTETVAKCNMFGAGLAIDNCDNFSRSGNADLFSSDRARILKAHAREVEVANYGFIKKSAAMNPAERNGELSSVNYDLYWVGNRLAPTEHEKGINEHGFNGINPYMAEPSLRVGGTLMHNGYDDHMFFLTAKLEKRFEGMDRSARLNELTKFLGGDPKEALKFDDLMQGKDDLNTRPERYKLITKMAENNFKEYEKYQQQQTMKGM